MNNETLLLVFVALTGAAVLLQAIILFALYLTVRKTSKLVSEGVDQLRTSVMPLLDNSREFLARVGPKIESVSTDMAELAHGLRAQSSDLHASAAEILERLRRQASRVDALLTIVLDAVDRVAGLVSGAVNVPVRQLSAILAAIKAILGALRTKSPEPRQTHSAADRGQFV